MGTVGKRLKKGIVPSAAGEKKGCRFSELVNMHAKSIIMISLKDKNNSYKEEACFEGTTEEGTL